MNNSAKCLFPVVFALSSLTACDLPTKLGHPEMSRHNKGPGIAYSWNNPGQVQYDALGNFIGTVR